MLLFILATCCLTLAVGRKVPHINIRDEDVPSLKWPDTYAVELSRTNLLAGFMEDIKAWKSNSSSRADFNNGAVKRITLMSNDLSDGDKYEIHPERVGEKSSLACHNIGSDSDLPVKLDEFLPSLDDEYEFVGYVEMLEEKVSEFEYIEEEDENMKQIVRTVWAVYETQENGALGWTPYRYEVKQFNNRLGSLVGHKVSEYLSIYVGAGYVKDDLFDIEKYNCDLISVKHDSHSDSITKNLMFIDPEDPKHVDHVFKSFKKDFQRQYTKDEETALRKAHFQNAMSLVSSVNNKNLGYKLAINEFADRTPQEMQQYTGLKRRPQGRAGNIPFPYKEATLKDELDDLPEEYDMRLLGLISPVKNQGACGSCWTFGTTAAVEGALAKTNGGRVMSLANQALIDCAWDMANGCNGGSDNAAYEWMMQYGLPTEEEYGSYQQYDGYCNINNMTNLYPIKGYTDVTPFSTVALQVALVNHGPLSVSVHVTDAFKLYSSGIYYEDGCGPDNLNHEVALVGYSVRDGELFWILKNSWGPVWGVDGYMYISARNNNCGVETEPTYVVL